MEAMEAMEASITHLADNDLRHERVLASGPGAAIGLRAVNVPCGRTLTDDDRPTSTHLRHWSRIRNVSVTPEGGHPDRRAIKLN